MGSTAQLGGQSTPAGVDVEARLRAAPSLTPAQVRSLRRAQQDALALLQMRVADHGDVDGVAEAATLLTACADAALSWSAMKLALKLSGNPEPMVRRLLVTEAFRGALDNARYHEPEGCCLDSLRPFVSVEAAMHLTKVEYPVAAALVANRCGEILAAGVWPTDAWPHSVQDVAELLAWPEIGATAEVILSALDGDK